MAFDSSFYDRIFWFRLSEAEKEDLIDKTKKMLVDNRIILAYLFGSFNRNLIARDIDIAIYAQPSLSFRDLLTLGARLEYELLLPVDIVQLQDLEPSLRLQILRKERPILVRDSQVASQIAVQALAEKQVVQFLRTPITSAGPEDYTEYDFENQGA
ncbi:MAG: nucleotidyltransferase domain-containing protein [Candidatus Hodarchaeales archaeon]|jgi:predicted nucleotidyltransferase